MTPYSPRERVGVIVWEGVSDRVAGVTDLVGDFDGVGPAGLFVADGFGVLEEVPGLPVNEGVNKEGLSEG